MEHWGGGEGRGGEKPGKKKRKMAPRGSGFRKVELECAQEAISLAKHRFGEMGVAAGCRAPRAA